MWKDNDSVCCIETKKIKGKLKFEDYKDCLEATQFENKINQLEKTKPDVDSFRKNDKKFINKL